MKKVTVAFATACIAGFILPATAGLIVNNYKDGETLRYPLALLRGTLTDRGTPELVVVNTTSTRDTRELKGVAYQGNFKGMAELVPGTNVLALRAGDETFGLTLVYTPQTNPYRVRAFYFVPPDGDTRFETPFKDDTYDFRGKYDAMLKCAQSFVADWMNARGYGRKTFNLEFDDNGKVIVHVVKAARPVAEYEKLGRIPIASTVGAEVIAAVGDQSCNYFGGVSFSRHIQKGQPGAGHATCYGMVNVGNISLFGGAIFYSWPDRLNDVIPRFMQDEVIEGANFHVDDPRGGRIWATAANTWGASLHELIHAYYVPHCADGAGVMATGYDQFNRYFTFFEPPTAKRAAGEWFIDNGRTHLSRVTAAALAPTRFMALDKREWQEPNTVTMDVDPPRGEFVFKSDYGIRFIAPEKWYGDGPHAQWYVEGPYDRPAPREVRITAAEILTNCKSVYGLSVRVIDAEGHYTLCNDLGSLLGPACIRNWKYAPEAIRWTDTNALPDLSEVQRTAIEEAALTSPLEKSGANQVDLRPYVRGKGVADTAVYAVRVIHSDRPRTLKVLGNANDTLRVWLNGELVLKAKGDEGPDLFSADMTLKAGVNRMLVEGWNHAGWFRMTVRLVGVDGKPLLLTDEGELKPAQDFEPYRPLFGGKEVGRRKPSGKPGK